MPTRPGRPARARVPMPAVSNRWRPTLPTDPEDSADQYPSSHHRDASDPQWWPSPHRGRAARGETRPVGPLARSGRPARANSLPLAHRRPPMTRSYEEVGERKGQEAIDVDNRACQDGQKSSGHLWHSWHAVVSLAHRLAERVRSECSTASTDEPRTLGHADERAPAHPGDAGDTSHNEHPLPKRCPRKRVKVTTARYAVERLPGAGPVPVPGPRRLPQADRRAPEDVVPGSAEDPDRASSTASDPAPRTDTCADECTSSGRVLSGRLGSAECTSSRSWPVATHSSASPPETPNATSPLWTAKSMTP